MEDNFKNMARKIWKHCEAVAIDALGTVRGVGILWDPSAISLSNFMATKFSISVEFHILGTSTKGFLTNVYEPFALVDKK